MASTKSALRYATALMDLGVEQGCVDALAKDFISFEAAVGSSKDFRVFLNSPVVRSDKKLQVFSALFPDFHSLTHAFLNLVTKNGREQLLPEIAVQFDNLVKKQREIVSGILRTATVLDSATIQAIMDKISPAFHGKLDLSVEVDPNLIGGFVVQIEDKQIDASVSSKLKTLKQELVK